MCWVGRVMRMKRRRRFGETGSRGTMGCEFGLDEFSEADSMGDGVRAKNCKFLLYFGFQV